MENKICHHCKKKYSGKDTFSAEMNSEIYSENSLLQMIGKMVLHIVENNLCKECQVKFAEAYGLTLRSKNETTM